MSLKLVVDSLQCINQLRGRILPTKNYQLKTNQRAFTLIELVVTMGIMAVITTVTLANHSKFGGQVTLRNLAYELALVVREAQTYGVSVRKTTKGAITNFEAGYGIHFDTSDLTHYIMFTDVLVAVGDIQGDGMYKGNLLEEVTTYAIGRGYKLNKLYAIDNTGARSDADDCPTGDAALDILFLRPEPDAIIRLCGSDAKIYNAAEIELISPRDDIMRVLVEVSGQISVTK